MPKVAVQPFVLKDVVLSIDTDDYEAHVSTVRFDPTQSTVTWQGLTPAAAFSDTTTPTWTCTLAGAQDWTTDGSLAQYLLDNAGQKKTCVFKPKGAAAGAPVFTADLLLAPPPIGGDVNTVQTFSVTCGVDGAPVKSVAA